MTKSDYEGVCIFASLSARLQPVEVLVWAEVLAIVTIWHTGQPFDFQIEAHLIAKEIGARCSSQNDH